jgi:outer membrane protein TolC
MKRLIFIFLIFIETAFSQNSLDYYLSKGLENSPTLKEIENSELTNKLQSDLNYSQTSAPQVFLSANYLFAPYFNNNGKILSTNPDTKAIGYDVGITNGGLYSAQINVEKNIFNGGLTDALDKQIGIQQKQFDYNYTLEQKNLKKQITDQYLTTYKSLLLYLLTKDILQNFDDQLKITADLVEKGFEKSQNYLLLKIEFQNQQIAMSEILQQYKADLLQLNSICGIKDTQTVFLDSVHVSMTDRNNKFNFLEKFNLDSLAAINQQSLIETKYLPQVKLFFNTGLNAVEITGIQRKFGLSVGVDFQLPILDGGQKDLTRQQNQISISSISSYKSYASATIDNQRQNTLTSISLIKNNLSKLNDQLKDYTSLINISKTQLNSGDISMIEFLSILRNFIDLRKNKIEKEIALQLEINNYNYWAE